jgi:hypothetical protein
MLAMMTVARPGISVKKHKEMRAPRMRGAKEVRDRVLIRPLANCVRALREEGVTVGEFRL